MWKNQTMHELINLLAVALRHKIGAIVNSNELYAQKYSRDADLLISLAEKSKDKENWNIYDKKEIKEKLKKQLEQELKEKEFINDKKFELVDSEIAQILRKLDLE